MKILDFVNALNIKEVQEYIKKEYGWGINQQYYRKMDIYHKNLNQIVEQIMAKVAQRVTDDLRNLLVENDMSQFTHIIQILEEKIKNTSNYSIDVESIIYLSFMQRDNVSDNGSDEDYIAELQESWNSGSYNKNIDIEKAKRYYPISLENLTKSNIQKGCREYHKVMMKTQNIAIFDFDTKLKSLKRYSFPQTYRIYKRLKDTSVDNLIFLELTQGLCYTDILYKHTKQITKREKINKLLPLVELGTEIQPMFFRNDLYKNIIVFLDEVEFKDEFIEGVTLIVKELVDSINWIFQEMIRLTWVLYKSYYDGATDIEQIKFLSERESMLNSIVKWYFLQDDIYLSWLEDENLHDWSQINGVQDCFFSIHEDNYLSRIHNEQPLFNYVRVPKPNGDIGEIIFNSVNIKMKDMEFKNVEECIDVYNTLCEKEYNELYQKEQELWNSKDPKANVSNLKYFHVYSILHERIVRMLNRI